MNTNANTTFRCILLATVGGTAQVVTETLYAIHDNKLQWPDEISVITTTVGAEKTRKGLLTDGHLDRLCNELGKDRPAFDETKILIIPDANGKPVEDARSLADHEALGDFIMTQVRDITADTTTMLHASLAGGRKTMTFYLGYAMSLFGRTQDMLSHVLVSERYENLPDFWYPSQSQGDLKKISRSGEVVEVLKSADAQITLAQIPFARMREDELPKSMRERGSTITFTALIQWINMGNNPDTIRLRINLHEGQLIISSATAVESSEFSVNLNKLELAFYAMCHRSSIENIPFQRPQADTPDVALLKRYSKELLALCRLPAQETYNDELEELQNWAELKDQLLLRSVDLLEEVDGIPRTWFDQRLNTIKSQLMENFPKSVVDRLLPSTREDGAKRKRGGNYRIGLNHESIELIEPS